MLCFFYHTGSLVNNNLLRSQYNDDTRNDIISMQGTPSKATCVQLHEQEQSPPRWHWPRLVLEPAGRLSPSLASVELNFATHSLDVCMYI